MKKNEIIDKYGEVAYDHHLENGRKYYSEHRHNIIDPLIILEGKVIIRG